VHLLGFITKTFVTMHGHMNVKKKKRWDSISRSTVDSNVAYVVDTCVCCLSPHNIRLQLTLLVVPLSLPPC